MCNRYYITRSAETIRGRFAIERDQLPSRRHPTKGEYFPGRQVPVVSTLGGQRTLSVADWGIRLGKHAVTNSRDDKLDSTWKRFMGRRVVFPLNRAVEWHYPDQDLYGNPTGKPRPWHLYPADESVAAVAGIASEGYAGVSMMTCKATGVAAEVHNKNPDDPRMIVFLTEEEDLARWLDPDVGMDEVRELLRPAPDGWLAAMPLAAAS